MEEVVKTSGFTRNANAKTDVFSPQDTGDRPCDIKLVVKSGQVAKAHREVLVEASPFFEKLLSTDMRESREGIIHLQMITESVLGDVLEFIYTGCVEITNEDRAQSLIEMADYLCLPHLKCLAGSVLISMLNCSNCVLLYHFAETFNCKELFSGAKRFIFTNFKTVATTDEFLNNMSRNEVEMWISSDDINVNEEEDVFEAILAWIDHDQVKRSIFFDELFRYVRLAHISSDYVRSNIATNRFLKSNESCLKLLRATLKSTGRKNDGEMSLKIKPRKSLETPVILFFERGRKENNLCYFPREDVWCNAPSAIPALHYRAFSSHDKLYLTGQTFEGGDFKLLRYDSFSNRSTSLSSLCSSLSLSKGVDPVCHIFVRAENEIYALVGERRGTTQERHLSSITRYKPESNSWEDVSTFDWDCRKGICIVNKDNFVYFLGGRVGYCCNLTCLSEAYRYDLCSNKWEKLPDMNVKRSDALGAAAHGKVFLIGGRGNSPPLANLRSCDVYNETTGEWHLTAGLTIPHRFSQGRVAGLMRVDDTLYVIGEYSVACACPRNPSGSLKANCAQHTSIIIGWYDPENDKWTMKTEMPERRMLSVDQACSITVLNRSKFVANAPSIMKSTILANSESLNQQTCREMGAEQKCLIL